METSKQSIQYICSSTLFKVLRRHCGHLSSFPPFRMNRMKQKLEFLILNDFDRVMNSEDFLCCACVLSSRECQLLLSFPHWLTLISCPSGLAASLCLWCAQLPLHPSGAAAERTWGEFPKKLHPDRSDNRVGARRRRRFLNDIRSDVHLVLFKLRSISIETFGRNPRSCARRCVIAC